jgi:tRNA modification GTPase
LLVVVLDRSRPLEGEDRDLLEEARTTRSVIAANKIDLPSAWDTGRETPDAVLVSATSGQGLDELRRAMSLRLAEAAGTRDAPAITNVRHVELVVRARHALERAAAAARAKTPEEFVLTDLNAARAALEEVTGARGADDTLAAIFTKFCIGK